MASDTESSTDAALEWPELESVVAELATLSRADIGPEELAAELLDRTLRVLAAVGGGVWLADRPGSLRLVHQQNGELHGPEVEERCQRARLKALETGTVQVVSAHANGVAGGPVEGHAWLLVIGPVIKDGGVEGLVEVVQRSTLDADALHGNRRFVELVCQTVSDYLGQRELRRLRRAQLQTHNLTAFVQKLHRSLSVTDVAYELANEGRRLLGCDRVGVAVRHGRGFRLVAISGVDRIERRSTAVRRLEALVGAAARLGEPFWHEGEVGDLPPQIHEPLELYLDETPVRACGILPMRSPGADDQAADGPAFAALVIEQFHGVADRALRESAETIADHGRLAVLNALRYESLPTLPFARQRDPAARSRLFRSPAAWACVAAAAVFGVLWLAPADFGVYAEGKLQPRERRDVFAPRDGRVTRLAVRHGEHVQAGGMLLELNSPELDVEIQRIQGEYDTTRKRLSVVESSLLEFGAGRDRDSMRSGELAAEQEELARLLESQRLQLALLAEERKRLVVTSPMDGAVLTWDAEELLKDRPVERGQSLLTIGDLDGRWIAELDVPDDQIGYVLERRSRTAEPLAATFQLATDRRREYRGVIRHVSARTELNESDRPVVRATVEFDEATVGELRPGATVFARVDCGRRSLGYVWFHRLIETVRGWAFYWAG